MFLHALTTLAQAASTPNPSGSGNQGTTGGEASGAGADEHILFHLEPIAEGVAKIIESIGIAVVVLGVILATYFLIGRMRRHGWGKEAYHGFRGDIGRSILLGLEFLVAADIIATVAVQPTLRSVSVLALIIVVRTFLSFSLEVEINGRWPWQRKQAE